MKNFLIIAPTLLFALAADASLFASQATCVNSDANGMNYQLLVDTSASSTIRPGLLVATLKEAVHGVSAVAENVEVRYNEKDMTLTIAFIQDSVIKEQVGIKENITLKLDGTDVTVESKISDSIVQTLICRVGGK